MSSEKAKNILSSALKAIEAQRKIKKIIIELLPEIEACDMELPEFIAKFLAVINCSLTDAIVKKSAPNIVVKAFLQQIADEAYTLVKSNRARSGAEKDEEIKDEDIEDMVKDLLKSFKKQAKED